MLEWIHSVDVSVLNTIQTYLHHPVLDPIFSVVTHLGDGGILWILLGILLICSKKYRKAGIAMLIALGIGAIFANLIVKPIVARPRPFVEFSELELIIPAPSGYSFPSGHSLASFTGAVILSWTNRKWIFPSFLMAALIAFSRMYLCVHYFSDVLTGSILGVIFGLAAIFILKKWEKNREDRSLAF
jgi:undecaprenyl-diphosphatase